MTPLTPHPTLTLIEALSPFRPLLAAFPAAIFAVWLLAVGAPGWVVFLGAAIIEAGLGYGDPT